MDGFELLEHDHREVERLFRNYEETGDQVIVREICFQLTLHDEVEGTVLYPAVRSLAADGSELANRAEREHATIKEYVEQAYDAQPAELPDLVLAMRAVVETHVAEEEQQVFPQLREGGVQAETLGEDLERAKDEARPRAAREAR